MKVAVVSDSHDNLAMIKKFLEDLKKRDVDIIFHLGDIISPFAAREFLNIEKQIIAIFGNNDGELKGLKKILDIERPPRKIEISGKKIILYHELYEENLEEYDYVFYGHTHKKNYTKKGKTLIINPGELCGYLSGHSTYMTVDLEDEKVFFHVL